MRLLPPKSKVEPKIQYDFVKPLATRPCPNDTSKKSAFVYVLLQDIHSKRSTIDFSKLKYKHGTIKVIKPTTDKGLSSFQVKDRWYTSVEEYSYNVGKLTGRVYKLVKQIAFINKNHKGKGTICANLLKITHEGFAVDTGGALRALDEHYIDNRYNQLNK